MNKIWLGLENLVKQKCIKDQTMGYLSKKDSAIIRTIAILMMIYYHFFGKENGGTYFDNAFWNLYIFNHSLQGTIAVFCKLCTSIFSFISGYGLYITFNESQRDEKAKIIYVLKKFINLHITYLLVLIIYIMLFKYYEKSITVVDILYNIVLMRRIIGPSWYIVFYYEAVSLLLILNLVISKKINPFIEFLLVTIIPAFIIYSFNDTGRFFHYISVFLYGYLIRKYCLYEKVSNIKNYRLISTLLLIILFAIRGIVGDEIYGFTMITFVTPVFVFVIRNVLKIIPKQLIDIIYRISKYTTYYWLLHCVFQCGIAETQKIAFLPYYSSLIIVWTILILTPVSIVLDHIRKKIEKIQERVILIE